MGRFRLCIRPSLVGFLFLLLTQNVRSQGIVRGVVRDSVSKEGLQNATFVLYNVYDSLIVGTITNEKGAFLCKNIPVGAYKAKVSYVTFEPKIIYVTVSSGTKNINLSDIWLTHNNHVLKEVIVKASGSKFHQLVDKATITFDSSDYRAKPLVIDALKGISGVTVDKRSEIKIMGAENVLLLVDGMTKSAMELQTIRTEDVERVEMTTNPSSEYDSEYAAVVNVILKKRKQYGLSLDAKLNGYTGNIYNFSGSTPI